MKTHVADNKEEWEQILRDIKTNEVWLQVFGIFIDYIPKDAEIILHKDGVRINWERVTSTPKPKTNSGYNFEDIDCVFDTDPILEDYNFGYPHSVMKYLTYDDNGIPKHVKFQDVLVATKPQELYKEAGCK